MIPVIQTGVNLAGDGSASAPSYSFASAPTTGLYWVSANNLGISMSGTRRYAIQDNSFSLLSDTAAIFLGASTDVSLSRGAANRLDLATGDSFHLVSGGLGVGVAETSAGRITASANFKINGGWIFTADADGVAVLTNNAGTAAPSLGLGPTASATSTRTLVKKVTGIADAVATDVITVTVPNANHAAAIKVTFLASTGSTDAFESSRVAEGAVILARTTGVATVAAVATLELAQIATVSAGATLTLAYGASAMTGAASATQTFTIQVTLNDSGNVGSNQCVVLAELINAEATGITIA